MYAKMVVETSKLEYKEGDSTMEGVLYLPKDYKKRGKIPAVLVCHAFFGRTEFEEEQAHRIASELGFVALAGDVYGKGKRGSTREEGSALIKPLREDRAGLLRRRMHASLNALTSVEYVDTEKIGVIGYCFGGMCALDVARLNLPGIRAVVSLHGTYTPAPDQPWDRAAEFGPLQASILICHGDADSHIPTEQCEGVKQELRARNADWHFIAYGNAKHGFTEKKFENSSIPGVGYDANAARRSWAATKEHLQYALSN